MIPRPLDVDITEAVRLGEGLFWSARMATFDGWGTWFADMSQTGATGHANGIGGAE